METSYGACLRLSELTSAGRETLLTPNSSHPKVKRGDNLPASFQTHFPRWSTLNTHHSAGWEGAIVSARTTSAARQQAHMKTNKPDLPWNR